jgi:Holliday junction DNA helicase RuvA
LGVSGCGPKTALAMASSGAQELITAIQQANVSYFTTFPRVGKKLAQKLIIELKNKLGGVKDLDLTPKSAAYADAFAALQVLGFADQQIQVALSELDVDAATTSETVKAVLKRLKQN